MFTPTPSRGIKAAIVNRLKAGFQSDKLWIDPSYLAIPEGFQADEEELAVQVSDIDTKSFFVKVGEGGAWRYFEVSVKEKI